MNKKRRPEKRRYRSEVWKMRRREYLLDCGRYAQAAREGLIGRVPIPFPRRQPCGAYEAAK